jgi:hypothetical protein
MSNTTQIDGISFKAYGKCQVSNSKNPKDDGCSTVDFHIANAHQVKTQGLIFINLHKKNVSSCKRVLSGPFFDFFSIFFVIYTCIRTV